MKLQVAKNALSLATNRVQGAIAERNLGQIALNAKGSQMQVAAADRVLAVYCRLDGEVMEEGCVFVPAKLFSEMVRELPDGPVRLETEKSYLVVSARQAGEFMMKLPLIEDTTWKGPPELGTEVMAELPSDQLAYLIDQIEFCVAQESPRNYGAVAYLHRPEPNKLRLVGTDGFRLSYCEVEATLPDAFLPTGVCLSKRGLMELARICSEGFDRIRLSISPDQTTLLADAPDYQIYMRLSSAKYPNYMGVLPSGKLTAVRVSRPYLLSVARRVLIASDKTRALQLCFAASSLTLSSRTVGSYEGKETIPLEDYDGPRCELIINGKFLSDVFSATRGEHLLLQFKNDENPIVVTSLEEPAGCKSMHVLVPIKETD